MIDDDFNTDCLLFLESNPTSTSQCTVDIVLTYNLTNTGLNCINIANIKADSGPLGSQVLEFDDVYSYQERDLCGNETWAVPDRRSSVDLCKDTKDETTWNILLDIDALYGNTTNATSNFTWSISPSVTPSIQPSMAPTINACLDCTLTGIISGGKSFDCTK